MKTLKTAEAYSLTHKGRPLEEQAQLCLKHFRDKYGCEPIEIAAAEDIREHLGVPAGPWSGPPGHLYLVLA